MRRFSNISGRLITVPLKAGDLSVHRCLGFTVDDGDNFEEINEMLRKREIIEIGGPYVPASKAVSKAVSVAIASEPTAPSYLDMVMPEPIAKTIEYIAEKEKAEMAINAPLPVPNVIAVPAPMVPVAQVLPKVSIPAIPKVEVPILIEEPKVEPEKKADIKIEKPPFFKIRKKRKK